MIPQITLWRIGGRGGHGGRLRVENENSGFSFSLTHQPARRNGEGTLLQRFQCACFHALARRFLAFQLVVFFSSFFFFLSWGGGGLVPGAGDATGRKAEIDLSEQN